MTFPQVPALPEELDRLMRRMRLPYMRKAAPDVLATARAQRWDPAEVLRLLITEEVTGRDAATRHLRRTTANFPTGKTLASWRAEDSTIPEPTQNSLATLEWIGRAENLVIAGPSGTGKSHFTEGLAHAAIEKELKVAWFSLETLSAAIGKSKVDGSTARTVARICRADLIVVDDIGLLPVGEDAAEAFYRIIDAAYERRSIAVTSNIHPSGFDTISPRPSPEPAPTDSCTTLTSSPPPETRTDPCLHEVREVMTYVEILHDFRFIRLAGRLHLSPQRSRSQLARITEVIEEAEQPQHAHPRQPLRSGQQSRRAYADSKAASTAHA